MSRKAGAGHPAGIRPATATPCRDRPNAPTQSAASSTASRGPGARGHRHWIRNRNASTLAAIAAVAGRVPPMRSANEAACAGNARPATGTPVAAASCPAIMINATPAR